MKLATILALLFCALSQAHELGTSRVSVVLKTPGTYDIELVTDATSLAEKLETVAGREPGPSLDASHLHDLFVHSDAEFRQRVKVKFDGADIQDTQAQPRITWSVAPAVDRTSVPSATIHLSGPIPDGARNFSWSYGWTFATYAFTVTRDGAPVTQWLEGGQTSTPISLSKPPAAQPDRPEIIWRYLKLGFTHIVPNGLDHMLFVLGIYLLSRRSRDVLWQVSAFTLAHSITLGLSVYGLVTVSPRLVEPVIALSIAYVAIENIVLSELRAWRVALVFAFGLLHGLGFAGALKELTLPRSDFLVAIVTFNAGVEAGQLTVIAAAFLLVGWQCSRHAWYRTRIVVPASSLIACVAVYWTIERMVY